MSNAEENKVEIAGAICAPPPQPLPVANGVEILQPRQPTNLNGLLKFAMEATKNEDAPHESHFQPLDDERKRYLQQALNSLTIDIVEVLLKQIRVLEKVDTLKDGDDNSEYLAAFDVIADYVCDIDTANDFHKLGGFAILLPCLKCVNSKIRAQACNLLAELCQNNPYCQRVFLENGFMPVLMNLVESDPDTEVVVKALYGIGCNVRQNTAGCSQFIQYRGVQILLEVLQRNIEKCNAKICFLLYALCESQPDFKSRLIFVGYIPVLFSLLTNEPNPSHELVLELLLKLIEDNPSAINECRQVKNNYKDVLTNYHQAVLDKEQFSTEQEYCETLCNILFPDQ